MVFLHPTQILEKLKLKESLTAADFGCGSGGWVIPLAKKLRLGKVYAIDILEEPLSALRAKLKLGRIQNVNIVKADVERNSKLLANSCDLILMTNLLFQAEDIKVVLEEGVRVLKKGGKILVVDWKKDAKLGPNERISQEEVKGIAKNINLTSEKDIEAGVYHWGLILVK